MSDSKHYRSRTIIGAVLGAAGVLVAGQFLPRADANVGSVSGGGGQTIPAIEIREGSIALVEGPGGQYFVVDRQGNAYPVRFRDADAIAPVGSTLLRSP
jgi:hypothetical protein